VGLQFDCQRSLLLLVSFVDITARLAGATCLVVKPLRARDADPLTRVTGPLVCDAHVIALGHVLDRVLSNVAVIR
jgi:hypothetical protein